MKVKEQHFYCFYDESGSLNNMIGWRVGYAGIPGELFPLQVDICDSMRSS